MSGDNYIRWKRAGAALTERQLRTLIELAEQLADPLADGSIDFADFADVRETDENMLTGEARVSKTYEHEPANERGREPD
jgi:hypothetical protein